MVALGRFGPAAAADLDALIAVIAPAVIPFEIIRPISRAMLSQITKRPARGRAEFGGCAAYALAVSEAEPLLFKGTDFGATDVEAVV